MDSFSSEDHESRRSPYREDERESAISDEQTPLIRFPNPTQERDPVTIIVVGILITVLLAGVVIGIYLLVLQSNSENILPPIDPVDIMPVVQWYESNVPLQSYSPFRAEQIVVDQTNTEQCNNTEECVQLLQKMQVGSTTMLQHNFLVSSNGLIFEALGWRRPPAYPQSSLVIAFIGGYTMMSPTQSQIESIKKLADYAVRHVYLKPDYTITGKSAQLSKMLEKAFSQRFKGN